MNIEVLIVNIKTFTNCGVALIKGSDKEPNIFKEFCLLYFFWEQVALV